MKWYFNLAKDMQEALHQIFNENRQGDKVVNSLLKSKRKWGSRDRKFVAKVLYDIIRWKRLYEYLAETDITTKEGQFLVLGVWSVLNDMPLPDWEEFQFIETKAIMDKYNRLTDEKIKQSVPDWLFELGQQQLKDTWINELKALNREAEVALRVNTLKTNRDQLKDLLLREGIETYLHPDYPEALFLKYRRKLTYLNAYKLGLFEIQDSSSQLVAPFTGAQAGDIVIDACAGAGGKTLHLATQMQNKGQIFAYDIYPSKINELNTRARRNGIKNIVASAVITDEIIKKNHEKADILLLDAPCSSLGTLARKPDLKWKLNPDKLAQINVVQQDIINRYEQMLKPGGYLIYVTCSILPQENQEIVNNFLATHKNYTFVEEKTIMPSRSIGDGFYMAKLKKSKQ